MPSEFLLAIKVSLRCSAQCQEKSLTTFYPVVYFCVKRHTLISEVARSFLCAETVSLLLQILPPGGQARYKLG